MPGWKLLKRVQSLAEKAALTHEKALEQARGGLAVCEMLSSRCRNVEFTALQMHKCNQHEHVAGRPAHLVSPSFHALGYRWKLFTVFESSSSTYLTVLQAPRDCRLPLAADFFVLRGQPVDVTFRYACGSHSFSPRHRQSEPVLLAEGAAADFLGELDSFHLRVGLVDKRAGRLDRGFMGQMNPAGHPLEDEWGEPVDSHDSDGLDHSEADFSDDSESGSRYY